MPTEKDQALAGLNVLAETCKAALTALATLSRSVFNTESASTEVVRSDLLSLHRLVHTSTTRLAVALGKPPPSYQIALVPLKDLTGYIGQLSSCVSVLPPGALRKEAVWATEEVLQALATLVQHFGSQFCVDGQIGDEYLAKTGAVHDAIEKAEKMSKNELEAVARAWRVNGESLDDSLREVKAMTDEADEGDLLEDDGWEELGEGFGGKLSPAESDRVEKVYLFLRFTTLLHGRILSHHILKPPPAGHSQAHLTGLLRLSCSLLPATDDLASFLYAPQDPENIRENAEAMHRIVKDFSQKLGFETSEEEAALQGLERLHMHANGTNDASTKIWRWFQQCFSQIDGIHESLSIYKPS